MAERKLAECVVREGELRRRILELAESRGLSKSSIKFGRMKVRIRAGGR